MKTIHRICQWALAVVSSLALCQPLMGQEQKDIVDYVNPLVGASTSTSAGKSAHGLGKTFPAHWNTHIPTGASPNLPGCWATKRTGRNTASCRWTTRTSGTITTASAGSAGGRQKDRSDHGKAKRHKTSTAPSRTLCSKDGSFHKICMDSSACWRKRNSPKS